MIFESNLDPTETEMLRSENKRLTYAIESMSQNSKKTYARFLKVREICAQLSLENAELRKKLDTIRKHAQNDCKCRFCVEIKEME